MSTDGAWMLLAFWREKDRFYDVRLLLFRIGRNFVMAERSLVKSWCLCAKIGSLVWMMLGQCVATHKC